MVHTSFLARSGRAVPRFQPSDVGVGWRQTGRLRSLAGAFGLAELRRLLGIWTIEREPGLLGSPRKADPAGFIDMDVIEAHWQSRGLDLKFRR